MEFNFTKEMLNGIDIKTLVVWGNEDDVSKYMNLYSLYTTPILITVFIYEILKLLPGFPEMFNSLKNNKLVVSYKNHYF